MVECISRRPPLADERERMHGFPTGYTEGRHVEGDRIREHFTEDERKSMIGNSFSCIAVATILAPWATQEQYLQRQPRVSELWERAQRDDENQRWEWPALMETGPSKVPPMPEQASYELMNDRDAYEPCLEEKSDRSPAKGRSRKSADTERSLR